jgi:hypothetical protein
MILCRNEILNLFLGHPSFKNADQDEDEATRKKSHSFIFQCQLTSYYTDSSRSMSTMAVDENDCVSFVNEFTKDFAAKSVALYVVVGTRDWAYDSRYSLSSDVYIQHFTRIYNSIKSCKIKNCWFSFENCCFLLFFVFVGSG